MSKPIDVSVWHEILSRNIPMNIDMERVASVKKWADGLAFIQFNRASPNPPNLKLSESYDDFVKRAEALYPTLSL